MYIHEAVMKANRIDGYIARLEWMGDIMVKPTDTDSCCIIESNINPPSRGWQPFAEDLIADDWVVIIKE